jgi:hypothetical protein
MSIRRFVQQTRDNKQHFFSNKLEKIRESYELIERVDTTLNASITELFPALAFNGKFKPSNIEDFKKFLYKLNMNGTVVKKTCLRQDISAAKLVIDKLASMDERFLKDKMNNAIGITNYLYDLNSTKPIDKVIWGYRAKPAGIPKNHAGDIFVFFKNKSKIGISLKAGTKTSKEPLKNTYVGTQYKNLGIDTKKLENDLWNKVYSKIPGVSDVANKNNFIKNKEVTKLYVDYHEENRVEADELYHEMLVVCRQHMCKVINNMSTPDFIQWCKETFNLQQKGQDVPLILVKAVGNKADEKVDDVAQILSLVDDHKAYLNKNSVQEYFIDIFYTGDKKTMKMTIRSDSGVRPEKGSTGQGKLGQYLQLKMQYSGVI